MEADGDDAAESLRRLVWMIYAMLRVCLTIPFVFFELFLHTGAKLNWGVYFK